ncbi:MAG: glycosyltransferase family 4 protein [Candidatus Omnitrophica bacterium]|nr:glycosyltransferase family 4 protein [Candidatus Omnitrophota bacterium]
MSKPKILYTIYSTGFAGTEKQLYSLCKNISDAFDIAVICPKDSRINEEFTDLSVSIKNYEFRLNEIFDISTYIKKECFDIAHNYLGKAELIGTLSARLAGIRNIITTKHFINPAYTFRSPLKKYLSLLGHKFINSLNSKIITVSESVREVTVKREKVDSSKVITIHNGTDIESKDAVKSAGFKIGTLSRLSEEKGIEYLIEAMPQILKKYPNVECLIAGRGPLEHRLKQKADALGLGDKVKFVGFVDDIKGFLDRLDVFVLSATEEPFGLAVVEAQMRGKAVVAVDAGGPKEIVINGKSGLLVPPKDPKSLADGVISLFDNREYAYQLAFEGKKRAKEFFTADRMARETTKVYEELLNPDKVEKKSKVLIVGHHFVTKNNQKRVEELAKHKDLEITLLTPYWWHEESRKVYLEKDYDKSYAVYKGRTLFTNHTALSFYLFSVYKLLWSIKPDIIDIYEEPWSLTTLQVLLFKKLFLKKSKVMFYSAQNINKKYPFPFNFIEKFTLNNADYCYPCSKGVVEVLRGKGYKGKVKVVPLGLDMEDDVKRAASNAFTIGYVGRFVEEKGILDLIEAVSGISKNYKLLLLGAGPLKDEIIKLAKEKGIENKLDFAGSVPRDKMPDYYAIMDVLIAPSKTIKRWKEQFGRMIVEAMSYGVPVIGSDSGSIPEVMAGCGLIFKEGDIAELKEKILLLMDSEALRDELREGGREYAIKNYKNEIVAEKHYSIYEALLK